SPSRPRSYTRADCRACGRFAPILPEGRRAAKWAVRQGAQQVQRRLAAQGGREVQRDRGDRVSVSPLPQPCQERRTWLCTLVTRTLRGWGCREKYTTRYPYFSTHSCTVGLTTPTRPAIRPRDTPWRRSSSTRGSSSARRRFL